MAIVVSFHQQHTPSVTPCPRHEPAVVLAGVTLLADRLAETGEVVGARQHCVRSTSLDPFNSPYERIDDTLLRASLELHLNYAFASYATSSGTDCTPPHALSARTPTAAPMYRRVVATSESSADDADRLSPIMQREGRHSRRFRGHSRTLAQTTLRLVRNRVKYRGSPATGAPVIPCQRALRACRRSRRSVTDAEEPRPVPHRPSPASTYSRGTGQPGPHAKRRTAVKT
jgi:hypothetical protein